MTSYQRLLAQATVTDVAAAEEWYGRLFEREPDARPMPGLIEYHLDDRFAVQVWEEPDRAGRASIMLVIDDLGAAAARLTDAGLDHGGIQDGGGGRLLTITDPDGTRLVLFEN